MAAPETDLVVARLNDGYDWTALSCGIETLDRHFQTQAG